MMKFLSFLFFNLLIISVLPAQDSLDVKRIMENSKKFSRLFVTGQTEALVNLYTPDAKIFPENKPILYGKEDLTEYWTPQPKGEWRRLAHKVTPEEIHIEGNVAYDYGYYEGKSIRRDQSGEESSFKGKYVIIWKKQEDGDWKIYLDIWSRVPPTTD